MQYQVSCLDKGRSVSPLCARLLRRAQRLAPGRAAGAFPGGYLHRPRPCALLIGSSSVKVPVRTDNHSHGHVSGSSGRSSALCQGSNCVKHNRHNAAMAFARIITRYLSDMPPFGGMLPQNGIKTVHEGRKSPTPFTQELVRCWIVHVHEQSQVAQHRMRMCF